jgi:hypothetical protein
MAINNIKFPADTSAFVYVEKEYDLYFRDELYAHTGDEIIKLKERI